MNNTCSLNSLINNSQRDLYQKQISKNHLNILEILNYLNQSQISNKQDLSEYSPQNQQYVPQIQYFETLIDQNNNFNFYDDSPKNYSPRIIHQRNQQNHDNSRNVSKEYILSQLKAQQRLKHVQQCFKEKQSLLNTKNSNEYLRHNFINSTNNFHSSHTQPQNSIADKIEILNDGNVKNIPPNLLLDQFGLIGLVMMMKINESNKDLSLIMGQGEESNTIVQSISSNLQYESIITSSTSYTINHLELTEKDGDIYNLSDIRSKLPDANLILENSHDDLLFYLFYENSSEFNQLLATKLLNSRGWFLNKESNSWFKNSSQDKNSYLVFDINTWSVQLRTLD